VRSSAVVFERIYRRNFWNGVESRSGPGSGPVATARVAEAIVELVRRHGVRSVLDVGCGDGYWMPDLPGYLGIDPAPSAVRAARERHSERGYLVGDVRDPGPWQRPHDLVLTRDAMQHMPLHMALDALAAIRATGSAWLLASTYRGGDNRDIKPGDYYEPDLEAKPFSLAYPAEMIFDGWDYGRPGVSRDPRKHLGLWRLAGMV
jgi:SAM-dependent methyltransferase